MRHSESVTNVVPGDFTHDGKLDILVMSADAWRDTLNIVVYTGNGDGTFAPEPISVPSSTLSQPIPVDVNGDMKIDLLSVPTSKRGSSTPLQVWENNWDISSPQSPLFELKVQYPNLLNGPFRLDRDGSMDMVFTTCSHVSSSSGVGAGCILNIAYNQQLPVCPSTTTTNVNKQGERICRSPVDLCVADPNFHYDLTATPDNDAFVRIPLRSLLQTSSSSILVLDTTFSPPIPLPLRLGDTNVDGFPDLLVISATSDAYTPKLLESRPCARGLAGCDENGNGRRGFKLVQKGAESLEAIRDARGVALLDLDEDGTLDILVQRTGAQGEGSISFIQNNFYYDAFFLKAIVGQLPQTSYHALHTPYAFMGLGRTNNYIENLFVGSTKHTQEHFINMEGVIPNSRVVIHPPPGKDDGSWKRELFLRPGEWIPWVTLTVVITMAILAVIVFMLHLNEKREDEFERRKLSHHINFDAL
ncbi:hypothetical protein ID866_10991 [Astraeus odoratus]|nr:hypothetical protein ID866_10991 [Astraeus odoratus]